MGERIRQLEDALAILQAKHSNEPHPLLRDDALTTTKTEPQFNEGNALSRETAQKPGDMIEAFGTLSVYDRGVSRFFGPSGGAEVRGYIQLQWFAGRYVRKVFSADSIHPHYSCRIQPWFLCNVLFGRRISGSQWR